MCTLDKSFGTMNPTVFFSLFLSAVDYNQYHSQSKYRQNLKRPNLTSDKCSYCHWKRSEMTLSEVSQLAEYVQHFGKQ